MNYGREDRKNNWKEKLREEFIIALTGSDIEIESAYIEIGKYYQTAAPQYLYKYYGDNLDRLETIKKIKCGIRLHVILMMFLNVKQLLIKIVL